MLSSTDRRLYPLRCVTHEIHLTENWELNKTCLVCKVAEVTVCKNHLHWSAWWWSPPTQNEVLEVKDTEVYVPPPAFKELLRNQGDPYGFQANLTGSAFLTILTGAAQKINFSFFQASLSLHYVGHPKSGLLSSRLVLDFLASTSACRIRASAFVL